VGFFALRKGVVSPFEEIVLISIREIGHGATFMQIFDKTRQLGRGLLGHISYYRLELALRALNMFGFIYSWPDLRRSDRIEDCNFRIQLKGERLLKAAKRTSRRRTAQGFASSSWHAENGLGLALRPPAIAAGHAAPIRLFRKNQANPRRHHINDH